MCAKFDVEEDEDDNDFGFEGNDEDGDYGDD